MEETITFEDMPKAMVQLMAKLEEIETKLEEIHQVICPCVEERWMSLKELREYLPSHPAEQTIYGWTSHHNIPYHKRGKRIMFLKSEIDQWLHDGKIKSQIELQKEALRFIQSKRREKFLSSSK